MHIPGKRSRPLDINRFRNAILWRGEHQICARACHEYKCGKSHQEAGINHKLSPPLTRYPHEKAATQAAGRQEYSRLQPQSGTVKKKRSHDIRVSESE
jgi:hypothetical protein